MVSTHFSSDFTLTRSKPLNYSSLSMSSFPEISALDFSLVSDPENGFLIQAPIQIPDFEFQHTSNFDYYLPCMQDFYYLDSPLNRYAVLRSDLASCYWESLKMKGRFILAAATGWSGDNTDELLPSTIPDGKLEEIGMIPPPFPPLHQLTYNFFLLPESPAKIREWIALWQLNSHQLSAWIAQAKVQSARLPSCSWKWPAPPIITYPITASPHSPCTTRSSLTDLEDGTSIHSDGSQNKDTGTLFGECPEPPSEFGTFSSPLSPFSNGFRSSGRVARAFQTMAEKATLKRTRDSSPMDPL